MDAAVRVDRPHMPGYGIAPAGDGSDLLPWSWAVERLGRSHNYLLATVSEGGEPHLAAVWGVWLDDGLVFSTSATSRKARNLAANPRCAITPDDATESVVLNGVAEPTTDADFIGTAERAFVAKYGEGFPAAEDNPVIRIRPAVVIAVIERDDEFATRATRWTFARTT